MLLHYSEYDEEKDDTHRDNYMYEKKYKKNRNKKNKNNKKNQEDMLTWVINAMQEKNANSYLFHYMDHFGEVMLHRRGVNCAAEGTSEGVPPVEIPPVEIPPVEAPPVEAPPVEAPPVEAPPVEAPPVEAPPVEAPPVEDAEQENIISIINLPQNEEIKKIFIHVLYTYAKTLLIISSHPGGQAHQKRQRVCYEQYCVERSERAKDNLSGEGDNEGGVPNDQIYDNFECHNNFDSYEKYLNGENADACISCLSAYVELTNFENTESIFTLALVYLNAHKYAEAEKLASYLIEILKRKECQRRKKGGPPPSPSSPTSSSSPPPSPPGEPPEEEPPMDMKKLHLYSSFSQPHIDVTVEICIYIKALCFFFQRNYVHYYINMSILMSANENKLRLEVERSASVLGGHMGGNDPSGKKAKCEESERRDKTGFSSRNSGNVDNVGDVSGLSGVADNASDEEGRAQDQNRKKKKKKKYERRRRHTPRKPRR
ncbi:hypothetical protein PCYB_052140 [Plasmodium cynomolgi strain B]|uniref:Uncharacterized protein n=1 Tax=Plasmodium cynomolgi (strain B) TaxID=1120755 RepID=K6UCP2_PLACD|nr:hypothetical protein PCYB_052140 [Plasmodium cynomolgi strain B]GAB65196.1 hypothetical protein PCYB_052140 [Plasmodium cynomolgi strain B]